MTVTVTGQKPAVLNPLIPIGCAGPFDPITPFSQNIINPLRAGLVSGTTARVVNGRGVDITADLEDLFLACLGDSIDPNAEADAKSLLAQTLISFDQKNLLPVGEMFVIQAAARAKLPPPVINAQAALPGQAIYSTAGDLIPEAKSLLAGAPSDDNFFATLAFLYHPDTLGFWFQTEQAFEDFKTYLKQQALTLGQTLPPDTRQFLNQFAALTLDGLTESLQLRGTSRDNNHEFSFARFIVNQLTAYVASQRAASPGAALTSGILPFTVNELLCPRSIVLVNLEKHARSTAAKVDREWDLINKSLATRPTVLSNRNISKLTAMQRISTKLAAAPVSSINGKKVGAKSAKVAFRKKPPKGVDLAKDLDRVLKRMDKVNRSQNVKRIERVSFAKANRRDPDDYNKPGVVQRVSYMPDIHIFIDTSGSISESNYQATVVMLIHIAKKLNINLFFNSFSDVLSQETMLRVEGKSVEQIWAAFRSVPKVTGSTDFRQIWDYINASPVRKRRLSLMITDFEWTPPAARVEHPRNLYYAPCGGMSWKRMVRSATEYMKSMRHIEPALAQRLLGLVQ